MGTDGLPAAEGSEDDVYRAITEHGIHWFGVVVKFMDTDLPRWIL